MTVQVTRNFAANLEEIREFLAEAGVPEAFEALLDRLFDRVVPTLAEFPEAGFDFLERQPGSGELQLQWRQLLTRTTADGTRIREYVSAEYLVLYAVRGEAVTLLSIKHHRQLSFDLGGIWGSVVKG